MAHRHSVFAMVSGAAFACGSGGDGRLGLGKSSPRVFRPTAVRFLRDGGGGRVAVRVVAVSASAPGPAASDSGAHTLFLAEGGAVYGCGSAGNARLGKPDACFFLYGLVFFCYEVLLKYTIVSYCACVRGRKGASHITRKLNS